MTHTRAPVTVLKLTGLRRSGSTILDVVLGNHPSTESVGEVGNLARSGWISPGSLHGIDPKRLPSRPLCTCGKRLDVPYVESPEEACPFWSGVRREWAGRVDPDAIEGYPKHQNNFELGKAYLQIVPRVRLLRNIQDAASELPRNLFHALG